MTRTYDFIAIGGGNAGLTASSRIKAAGHKVALIDKGAIGGLCSLNGCNPKKVLVRSSELFGEFQRAAKFGITASGATIDWNKVIDRKESFTNTVTEGSLKSLADQGIDFIPGAARFVGRNAVEVKGERIEFKAALVCTGSYPTKLSFPGAESTKISDDLLALRTVPKRLVIIGAGVIAFEMGQVFGRLGSEVTILARGKDALAGNDPDLVRAVVEYSATLGVKVEFDVEMQAVRQSSGALAVQFKHGDQPREIAADFILNAAGRAPAIDTLNLEAAEVEYDRRGIKTNDYLRSPKNPAIFAGGDAHGRLQLSPVASWEGRVVARNFLENDTEKAQFEFIPKCIYTVPPLASVGLTEAQARQQGLRFTAHLSDMSAWKAYAILGEEVAMAKVLVEEGSERILGAHILGLSAGEQIMFFVLAMRYGIPAAELRNMVFTYPSVASTIGYTMG